MSAARRLTAKPWHAPLRPAAKSFVNAGKSYYRASGEGQAKCLRGLQAGSRLAGRQRRLEYVAGAVFFATNIPLIANHFIAHNEYAQAMIFDSSTSDAFRN
ncbi:hypothetical protein NITHO_40003 [Nitrolancea hollandica Lb]|uniref:Uncharacterized protein n=1 Tax=Nitrolancea hollandica Lb TaxID=1129897 RepID=I4EJE7_9BACT|nr:hypothetical protein NITHO_40003 [Nitrolancea hollandica Lb]